ncbi:MAG: hypothetical protein HC887_03330 [Desulfobacteraceae bacterium]|nr:hypothetical protein [Desulfobacteraceae bacterium]
MGRASGSTCISISHRFKKSWKQHYALIFPELRIDLNSADKPLTGFAMAALNAPHNLDENKEFLGYLITIEGGVIKDQKSRAALIVDVAGMTKELTFPYGKEVGQEASSLFIEFFSVERRGKRDRYEGGKRPEIPPCAINLVLTAQRVSTKDTVLVSVDSMSIEAIELSV